jgi:hypothetical protein
MRRKSHLLNLKRMSEEALMSTSKSFSGIHLKELGKTMRNHSQNRWCPARDVNSAFPEYKK